MNYFKDGQDVPKELVVATILEELDLVYDLSVDEGQKLISQGRGQHLNELLLIAYGVKVLIVVLDECLDLLRQLKWNISFQRYEGQVTHLLVQHC